MNLDKISQIKKFDTSMVSESIELLGEQIKQVLRDSRNVSVPKKLTQGITQVVVSGMGGSNLGAGIVKSVMGEEIKVPISITPGYSVPAHVNNKTLYIVSSYSGNTEEPLEALKIAKKRRAKIIAITAHSKKNKLEKIMNRDKIPGYIFEHSHNPSNQPRLGLGYAIFGMMVLMGKARLFKTNKQEIENIISSLDKRNKKLNIGSKLKTNPAKKIATALYKKEPIIIASEHLVGNLRTMRNQFCETSKTFGSYLGLPDLNHFAMEGLSHPKSNKKDFVFLFFDSALYHKRIQKRSKLTKQVIRKNDIKAISHQLTGATKLEQAFELLQLGTWITYYLGMLNEVKPGQVPFVDWFKKQLK